MKSHNKLFTLILLLVLALVPTGAVHASGYSDGRVVFGDDFTLKAGQTLDGDLAVFGGDVLIEAGAVVRGSMAIIGGDAEIEAQASIEGDVAVIGGDLEVAGTVNGNLAIIGGGVSLSEAALVDGDIATMGGELIQSPGAVITGNVADNPSPSITIPDAPEGPNPRTWWVPDLVVERNPWTDVSNVFAQAAGMGLIATLVALFLQPQLERVGQAVTGQPIIAGSFGLLAVVVGLPALALVALTFILAPVSLLGGVALVLAWMFGLIAIGQEVGERFTRAVGQTWSQPLATGFGAFLLVLVGGSIGEIVPCGFLAPLLIGLVGLGATALTVFGTRVYPQVALPPAERPPAAE